MFWVTIFIITFGVLFSAIAADDPCRFEYYPTGVIDLTSVGNTNGTASFADNTADFKNHPWSMFICYFLIRIIQYLLIIDYTYNPCKPYSEGVECINVSICQS
jgi:hypothetical protein